MTLDPPNSREGSGGAGSVTLIEDVTLGADAASIDFQSIADSYAHLLIVGTVRTTEAAIQSSLLVRLNNDSGANYSCAYFYVLAGGATGVGAASQTATSITAALVSGGTATAGNAAALRIMLPAYAGTTFRKSLRCESEYSRDDGANDPVTTFGGGTWRSTAAVSRVTVLPGANDFLAGSRLSLYGLAA